MELKFKEADDGYRATFITGGRCGLLLNREREGVVYFNYSDGDGEPVPIPYADRRKDIYIPFNLPSGVWVTVVSKTPVLYAAVSGDAIPEPQADPNQKYYPNAIQDYDGNWYNALIVGDQVWLAENLKTTHYADGTEIPIGTEQSKDTSYRYYPNGDSTNMTNYGYLYNAAALLYGESMSSENPSGVQGIAPTGWHIPSAAEWTQLCNYFSTIPDYFPEGYPAQISKAIASDYGWNTSTVASSPGNNQQLNNATLLCLPPSGACNGYTGGNLHYLGIGNFAGLWTCSQNTTYPKYISIFEVEYHTSSPRFTYDAAEDAYPVRCICNKTPAEFAEWYVKTYKTTNHQVENKYAE